MGRKVSEEKSVKVAVPASTVITQGDFHLIAGFLGMAVQSLETDADGKVIKFNGSTVPAGIVSAEVTLNIEPGEYETSQIDAADAFAAGDKVYWDAANKRFTTVATDGAFCGIVTQTKDENNVIWFWFAPQQPAFEQATTVAAVAAADAVAAAGANPTKAEFDAVVTLANETKAQLNAALAALKAATQMAN